MNLHLRRINAGLVQLVICFIAGIAIGTLFGVASAPLRLTLTGTGGNFLTLVWLPLLVLFLGTSTVGHRIILLLMFLRGFLLTASFSILLCSGFEAVSSFLTVGLPAAFSVPAFFLLCEDAVSTSRIIGLCSECNLIRNCRYMQPGRLLISVTLLILAAAVQIYILPLIV